MKHIAIGSQNESSARVYGLWLAFDVKVKVAMDPPVFRGFGFDPIDHLDR